MSHLKAARDGLQAVEDEKYDEAVAKLSEAIEQSPNPKWLLGRAKAYVGLGRFDEALHDTHRAWHSAYNRNDRDAMASAQYRRGVVLGRLGRFADADVCFVYSMRLIKGNAPREKPDPKLALTNFDGCSLANLEQVTAEAKWEPMNTCEQVMRKPTDIPAIYNSNKTEWRLASIMRMHVVREMEALAQGHDGRKITISIEPELDAAVIEADKAQRKVEDEESKPGDSTMVSTDSSRKWNVQFFETMESIYLTLFCKGVNKENVLVELTPLAVQLTAEVLPSGKLLRYNLELSDYIETAWYTCNVTPYKIELKMRKKEAYKWGKPGIRADDLGEFRFVKPGELRSVFSKPNLDRMKPWRSRLVVGLEPTDDVKYEPPPTVQLPSVYTIAAGSGAKDWDKIGAEEGEEEADSVQKFFQSIYKSGTPEQQRAMVKSFTESNGTSLSTDWEQVKRQPVETVPPEGVEAKPWK
ncbi:hypothetical protein CDD81_1720 [Ophiocordyceps australis]|uniref:SGS domain-containing protein n=1 Tax=Ophiocordyceps australis TaxID=1399860 RepID=A0A2C5YF83_9HYPO|nr:hypothetical protein CDD81_1720 [Ophiocordyceps australis]